MGGENKSRKRSYKEESAAACGRLLKLHKTEKEEMKYRNIRCAGNTGLYVGPINRGLAN
jgi:hypothetical protein